MFGSSEHKRETVKRYTQSRPEQRDIDTNQNTTNKKILKTLTHTNALDTIWHDRIVKPVKGETHWIHQGDDFHQLSALFYYVYIQIATNQIHYDKCFRNK